MGKPREYCCCAIPLFNGGIYATIIEQFTLGILVGTLSIATPSIVGAAVFSGAAWILAIICYVGAGLQVLGFMSVAQEKPVMYRRYVTLHSMITFAAFSVAAVWIAISASRHSTAKSTCLNTFFDPSNSTSEDEGNIMCNIFPWVDVGVMAGLWAILAIVQTYLYFVVNSYGRAQRRDHEKYDNSIPLNPRADPWDARDDAEETGYDYGHTRQPSDAAAALLSSKQEPYMDNGYPQRATSPPGRQATTRTGAPTRQTSSATSMYSQPSAPRGAYMHQDVPTPVQNNYYNAGGYANSYSMGAQIERPAMSQSHPAEGSFRRKTPRLPDGPGRTDNY